MRSKRPSFNQYVATTGTPSEQNDTNANLTRDYGDTLMLTSLPIDEEAMVERKGSQTALRTRKVSHQRPARQAFTQLKNFSNGEVHATDLDAE